MHWSKKIAEDVIAKHPDLPEYVVASGISPSGSVHIGNFREFVTNYYVAKALKKLGKKVKMLYSWDDFDRYRKIPKNFAEILVGFENYIGCALAEIPNPFCTKAKNYAGHFEDEFEKALTELRMNEVPIEFKYQAAEYKSGRYADGIIQAIKQRKQIYDIIMSFKTQDGDEGERETYYPIQIYCPTCGKDSTRVVSCSEDCTKIEYECKCSAEKFTADIRTAKNIKLVWKVDWPMRWKAEGVVFEASGIDHLADGGSYFVSSRIAREVYGVEPPETHCFARVGLQGVGVMHSSTGRALTPAFFMEIYESEMIRWVFAKYDPLAAFDFAFDETIIRHYQEFDRGVQKFLAKEKMEEYDRSIFEICLYNNSKSAHKVSFGTLATVAPLASFDTKLIEKMLGTPADKTRVAKVKFWLENYAPDKIYKLRETFNTEFFNTISAQEKGVMENLAAFLGQKHTEKEIQEHLYAIINNPNASKKENIDAQQRYFKIFYNMLFGRDDGPRLYLYLAVAEKDKYLALLVPNKNVRSVIPSVAEGSLQPTDKTKKSPQIKVSINPEIYDHFGNVTVGVLEAVTSAPIDYKELVAYTNKIIAESAGKLNEIQPQIKKWNDLFKQMNAEKGRESSVVYLANTLRTKGKLFNIHPMVDFYNAISVKHGLPMGAYDMEKVNGDIQLRYAKAGEAFVGINGKETEKTASNEVIYSDNSGVTCRYWNDRDCDRTKITKETTQFIIFFDGVDDEARIRAAQEEMQQVLKSFSCKSYTIAKRTIKTTPAQALKILKKYMTKENLIRHSLTVSGVMKHFARLQEEDENYWAVLGLLHDIDYEQYTDQHCFKLVEILKKEGFDEGFIRTIQSHGYPEVDTGVRPETYMENVLAAIDQLSGLIIACALIRPEKKLANVSLESILKRWKVPAFAAGTNREAIQARCVDLGVSLDYLAAETLKAMQCFAGEIGL